jgi:hypothetical protein
MHVDHCQKGSDKKTVTRKFEEIRFAEHNFPVYVVDLNFSRHFKDDETVRCNFSTDMLLVLGKLKGSTIFITTVEMIRI